jgi:hypothetical protein
MVESESKVKAFIFDAIQEQSGGQLVVRGRTFKVGVSGFSWEGYNVHLPTKMAKRLRCGLSGKFTYAGIVYNVSCGNQQAIGNGLVQVHLRRERDDEEIRRDKNRKFRAFVPATHSLNQRDPVLGFATGVFFVVMLLVLPGWGEASGSSEFFTEGFRTVFVNVCDACKCLAG